MTQSKKSYNTLTEKEKTSILQQYYVQDKKSFDEIAKIYSTYANKIRRDAKKLNIPIRSKSEAQKNVLSQGKVEHPTKGKQRSAETKRKIGMKVLQSWEDMDEHKLQSFKNKQQQIWKSKSQEERAILQKAATDAIRVSSRTGSKLEKFLLEGLLAAGIDTKFHYEQTLVNTKLQIDLFVPSINLAIEVDGPSHFDPVWGEDALKKTQTYDNKKQGLILGKGMNLVRIKQTMDFSRSRSSIMLDKLLILVNKLTDGFSTPDKYFEIKDK